MAWPVVARLGMSWQVWQGMVGPGVAWIVAARQGRRGTSRLVLDWLGEAGEAWLGPARLGGARQARRGLLWCG